MALPLTTIRTKLLFKLAFSLTCGIILSGCGHLFYYPSRNAFSDPGKFGLKYETVTLHTSDGVKLHGWYFPAKNKDRRPAKGTFIQFHGNAQNITTHFASLVWVIEAGYNFFTFDYRGYGTSEGNPSQEGLYRDALAAIHYIHEREPRPAARNGTKQTEPDLVFYGQSLGGAVLLRALEDVPDRSRIRLVAIDSSFHSYKSVARRKLAGHWVTFLFQPLGWLLVSDAYSPEDSIPKLAPTPVLVLHGEHDGAVPFSCGKKIYELANPPKWFWEIKDGNHIDAMTLHNGTYRDKLLELLDSWPYR